MSQDQLAKLQEQLSLAISKIASMESELAPLRSSARQQAQPTPQQIIQAMIQNPLGTMTQFGVSKEYRQNMTAALVAAEMQEMGLPVDSRTAARLEQFPQSQRVDALASELQALRQREEAREAEAKKVVNRESLKNVSTDKTKYPYLAAALAKNPELLASRVTAESDVAALAGSIEQELAATAAALGFTLKPEAQTASQEHAGIANTTTSSQVTAQAVDTRAGDPPPLPKQTLKSGFSEDDDRALKDEIARKYSAGAYGVTEPR